MAETGKKRIAVLGLALESNAFAPVTTEQDFRERGYFIGEEMRQAGILQPYLDPAGQGFAGVMTRLGDWQMVPILFAMGAAGGPCDHGFFEAVLDDMLARLEAAKPIDGVYIIGHGAGTTTETDDMDGRYFAAVREAVGADVPIVATLDLHGNVSDEMVASADVMIAFLTNPHVDMVARSAEAALLIAELFEGMTPETAFIRLPLVTPQVTQLTAPGHPYGDLIETGQTQMRTRYGGAIANVSILSGFAFSDTRHNGMAIVVTARNDRAAAEALAGELAARAWDDRARYVPALISVDEAAGYARSNTGQPIILADVADNPGGGGRGNTVWLLEALYQVKAGNVLIGVFYDPALVRDASDHGQGARFRARFNRNETSEFSLPFAAEAEVLAVTDGKFMGERGMAAGVPVDLGPSCLLRLDGIRIAVISIRQQILSSETFEHFGADPGTAGTIVIKSRGHFRAGFAHLVPDDRVFEVDAPGLTTPNLDRVKWKNLPRPVYPLDVETAWSLT